MANDKQKAEKIIVTIGKTVDDSMTPFIKIKGFTEKIAEQLEKLSRLLGDSNLSEEEEKKLLNDAQQKVRPFRRNLLILAEKLEMAEKLENGFELMAANEIPEEGSTFSDFLSNIGASVVESQQKLDDQSLAYLASTRDRKYIPPTLFRIPKISAELKVALSDEKSKGLNVLLFSEKRKMNRLNQQSLKFDIVAVPPSPDMLKAAFEEIPRIDFVFERPERKKVFSILHDEELLNTIENARIKKQIVEISAEARQNQVVIWRIDENEKYLLLYPDPDGDEDSGLGIWHLDGKNKTIDTVMRGDLKPKPGETKRPLWAFFTKLANDQQVLIG